MNVYESQQVNCLLPPLPNPFPRHFPKAQGGPSAPCNANIPVGNHTSLPTPLIHPYPPKDSIKATDPDVSMFGMAEDEGDSDEDGGGDEDDIGPTQDSEEFLMGYVHDDPYNPEGAVAPFNHPLKANSIKHKPRKGEQCKSISIEDIDQHLAIFLHVQWLLEGDPHRGCCHKVLNHRYINLAAGMLLCVPICTSLHSH